MFSVVFVVISFIAIIGITLVIVEAHNAPLLADDEMTITMYKEGGVTVFYERHILASASMKKL